jgi:cytidine deaminase
VIGDVERELYQRTLELKERAYAPYSGFHVGAVLRARDGTRFEGVNVENAAYPLGMCAERVALSRAVVEGCGPGQIEAVAATASPCGGCRQWLYEFEVERVTFRSSDDRIVTYSARELLPETWDEL